MVYTPLMKGLVSADRRQKAACLMHALEISQSPAEYNAAPLSSAMYQMLLLACTKDHVVQRILSQLENFSGFVDAQAVR